MYPVKKRFIEKKSLFILCLIICISFCTVILLNPVSAAITETKGCCLESSSGNLCQYIKASECKSGSSFSFGQTCDLKSECSDFVCCEKDSECFANVLSIKCSAEQGAIYSDKTCLSVEQCRKACCIIGSDYRFVAESKCTEISKLFPTLKIEFIPEIGTEQECLELQNKQTYGCCEETLQYQAQSDCTGKFYSGKFCSEIMPELQKHFTKKCHNNNVYWYDSLGNREDIAQTCDFFESKICKETENTAECIDNSCVDAIASLITGEKVTRKSGESWCLYDTGKIMLGYDVVGSRHYRAQCMNAEFFIEPCEDYRGEFCFETSSEDNYMVAKCIENQAGKCTDDCNTYQTELTQDALEEDKECCESTQACTWLGDETQGKCYPLVSQASQFWNEKPDNSICSQGSSTCEVIYERKRNIWGKCDETGKIYNKGCLTQEWLNTANQICKMHGDCGANYNIAGEFTTDGLDENHHLNIELSKENFFEEYLKMHGSISFEASKHKAREVAEDWWTAISWIALLPTGFLWDRPCKQKEVVYVAECEPWTAPDNGDCSKCTDAERNNLLGSEACTEYRCKSLGKNCELAQMPSGLACIDSNPNDISAPVISPDINVFKEQNLQVQDYGRQGFNIVSEIDINKPLIIGIKTSEPATCMYETRIAETQEQNNQNNEFLSGIFDSENNYNHKIEYTDWNNNKLSVKCSDYHSNENAQLYVISFAAPSGPDLTAPYIYKTEPENNFKFKNDLAKIPVTLYVYDSKSTVECTEAKTQKQFICSENKINGYFQCTSLFENLQPKNTYYFRCTDAENNSMQSDYIYSLFRSEPLQILEASPSGDLLYTDITLFAKTSEDAVCEYSISGLPYTKFINTGTKTHTQPQMNLEKGAYAYNIKCTDKAGNIAAAKINFEITADTAPPKLLYIYSERNKIYVILNEQSVCTANSIQMSGSGSTVNSVEIESYKYKIECKDKDNNKISSIEIYP